MNSSEVHIPVDVEYKESTLRIPKKGFVTGEVYFMKRVACAIALVVATVITTESGHAEDLQFDSTRANPLPKPLNQADRIKQLQQSMQQRRAQMGTQAPFDTQLPRAGMSSPAPALPDFQSGFPPLRQRTTGGANGGATTFGGMPPLLPAAGPTGGSPSFLPTEGQAAAATKPLFKQGELEKVLENKAHQYRMQTPGFVDHPRELPKQGEVTSVKDALLRRRTEIEQAR